MAESGGLRLFFALWPDDDLRARIVRETQAQVADSGGRIISPENLHVTLLFLGHTPRARLEEVIASAARTRGVRFRITFDQIETWARSHVLSLTSSAPPREASELAGALRVQLAGIVRDEEREFRPHVTLARDSRRRIRLGPTPPIDWPAREFVLVESNMTRTGSQYAVRERWPLAG